MGSLLSQVSVVTDRDLSYPLSKEERVQVRITLPDRVEAPVEKGTIAGKLSFRVGETTVGETYLLYDADVPLDTPRPTLFGRIKAFLSGGERPAALSEALSIP